MGRMARRYEKLDSVAIKIFFCLTLLTFFANADMVEYRSENVEIDGNTFLVTLSYENTTSAPTTHSLLKVRVESENKTMASVGWVRILNEGKEAAWTDIELDYRNNFSQNLTTKKPLTAGNYTVILDIGSHANNVFNFSIYEYPSGRIDKIEKEEVTLTLNEDGTLLETIRQISKINQTGEIRVKRAQLRGGQPFPPEHIIDEVEVYRVEKYKTPYYEVSELWPGGCDGQYEINRTRNEIQTCGEYRESMNDIQMLFKARLIPRNKTITTDCTEEQYIKDTIKIAFDRPNVEVIVRLRPGTNIEFNETSEMGFEDNSGIVTPMLDKNPCFKSSEGWDCYARIGNLPQNKTLYLSAEIVGYKKDIHETINAETKRKKEINERYDAEIAVTLIIGFALFILTLVTIKKTSDNSPVNIYDATGAAILTVLASQLPSFGADMRYAGIKVFIPLIVGLATFIVLYLMSRYSEKTIDLREKIRGIVNISH
ncbi:Uncharacterised protein [Candidatus Norongarragalina meridionalis]|nr:Uncharacterised protein [Candidatus Norongarragalina meridionalis]